MKLNDFHYSDPTRSLPACAEYAAGAVDATGGLSAAHLSAVARELAGLAPEAPITRGQLLAAIGHIRAEQGAWRARLHATKQRRARAQRRGL